MPLFMFEGKIRVELVLSTVQHCPALSSTVGKRLDNWQGEGQVMKLGKSSCARSIGRTVSACWTLLELCLQCLQCLQSAVSAAGAWTGCDEGSRLEGRRG